MRARSILGVALVQLSLSGLGVAQKVPPLEQVLPRVQESVNEFEFLLPDFICYERITSRELIGTKLIKQISVGSAFSGSQRKDEKGKPFIESREIKIFDGREAGQKQKLDIPFFFGGGFSSVLDMTFAARNVPYHNYKVIRLEQIDGRPLLVIEFATKPDQAGLYFEFQGTLLDKGAGKAWIDPESMHVVRIERRFLNVPSPVNALSVSIDYAPVVINGKTFWMPKTVKAVEALGRSTKKPMSGEYIAEYSNYRKFEVSVKIESAQ